MNFKESKCKSFWLHRYEIVATYHFPPDAVKERCARCGKEIVHKLNANGDANNFEYLKHHARECLLPQHSLYSHEYPNAR